MLPNRSSWRVEATDPDKPEPFNIAIRTCRDGAHANEVADELRQRGWAHVVIVKPEPPPAKPARPHTYRGFRKW